MVLNLTVENYIPFTKRQNGNAIRIFSLGQKNILKYKIKKRVNESFYVFKIVSLFFIKLFLAALQIIIQPATDTELEQFLFSCFIISQDK